MPPKNRLVETIKSDETRDLLADGTDTVIDVLSESEVASQIPFAGLVVKTYQASKSIRERMQIKKLAKFLEYPSQMSEAEKNKFAAQFENVDKEEEFGEQMLVLIDKADDAEKPKIIGRLLAARVKGHFDQNTFMRLCKMVDRAFVEDFRHLRVLRNGENHMADEDVEQSLRSSGFLRQINNTDTAIISGVPVGPGGFKLTQYGRWLVDLGLSDGPIPSPEKERTHFS
ncbi:MAG: hypothetical protein HLUCCA13_05505 [Halomonas sp. HL-48]|nr:hypothetical protein [Halomonas sp. HL-48]KPQ25484.1 MAG: hypothetical protein HLUCCA13_05505 [Halomonas sp. HL-48]